MYGFSLDCSSGGGSGDRPSWAASFRFSGDMASRLCGGTGLWVPLPTRPFPWALGLVAPESWEGLTIGLYRPGSTPPVSPAVRPATSDSMSPLGGLLRPARLLVRRPLRGASHPGPACLVPCTLQATAQMSLPQGRLPGQGEPLCYYSLLEQPVLLLGVTLHTCHRWIVCPNAP